MEKTLVVSILEDTYRTIFANDDEIDKTKLFPEHWEDMPLDDKMIILDKAIASRSVIHIDYNEKNIEEGMKI